MTSRKYVILRLLIHRISNCPWQRSFNPLVKGSNPARPTTNLQYQIKALRAIVRSFVSAAGRSFNLESRLGALPLESLTQLGEKQCLGYRTGHSKTKS
jgi:hypothetical protein